METISSAEIREKFADVVAKSLHVPVERVTDEAYLDELGAESLDLIEITMETEEQCNVSIAEKSILQTAIEVFGPNVLEVNGVLTAKGKELLLARMPQLDAEKLAGEIAVKEFSREFMKVGNWVRMIETLAENTPCHCPRCGGDFAPAVALRMKCLSCGEITMTPSGEDLNKAWVKDYYQRSRPEVP
jgi:acyl carrier protein